MPPHYYFDEFVDFCMFAAVCSCLISKSDSISHFHDSYLAIGSTRHFFLDVTRNGSVSGWLALKLAVDGARHTDQSYSETAQTRRTTRRSGGSETTGIVGVIENIKQDLEEEMAKGKDEEARIGFAGFRFVLKSTVRKSAPSSYQTKKRDYRSCYLLLAYSWDICSGEAIPN